MFKQLILLAFLACFVDAQVPSLGVCPQISAKASFNWNSFSGKWYQNSKVPNFYEGLDKCTTVMFGGAAPNITYSVSAANANTSVFRNYTAKVSVADATIGSLNALFPNTPFGLSIPIKIIQTDYTNYAVLYACQEFFGLFNLQYAWVLSRGRFLLPPSTDAANAAYDTTKLSRTVLIPTDQLQCPLFY